MINEKTHICPYQPIINKDTCKICKQNGKSAIICMNIS